MKQSNHYINNPHKKSNEMGPNPLDAIQKLPHDDRERHEKQVKAIIKGMHLEEHETNDYDRLMKEGAQRVKNVRDWASARVQEAIDKGVDTTPTSSFMAETREQVMKRLLGNFEHYQRDELVMLISNFAFSAVVREVL